MKRALQFNLLLSTEQINHECLMIVVSNDATKENSWSIPMRGWHCKVPHDVFFCISTFLMTNEEVTSTFNAPNASHHGWIIIASTISMELYPLHAWYRSEIPRVVRNAANNNSEKRKKSQGIPSLSYLVYDLVQLVY